MIDMKKMVQVLLITANTGSIFENLEHGLSIWMNEFISEVKKKSSNGVKFVAIHFQETGGKLYSESSDVISKFFSELIKSMSKLNYKCGEGYIDSQELVEEQFTALSNVYFVHDSIAGRVCLWDFIGKKYQNVESFNICVGKDLEKSNTFQKLKFPPDFVPNIRFKKGYLRTRWKIDGIEMDLVNVHLFHDACNLIASSQFPSQFAQNRLKALNYTLERLDQTSASAMTKIPLFLFGDLNFRLNTQAVLERLRREESENGRNQIVIETKKFEIDNQDDRFRDYQWIKEYDFEAKGSNLLKEFDIKFFPSYPWKEDNSSSYMRTRIPAWCDRVLFNQEALQSAISLDHSKEYNLIGHDVPMGDHKPVYLQFHLKSAPDTPSEKNDTAFNAKFVDCSDEAISKEDSSDAAGTAVAQSEENSSSKCNCNGIIRYLRQNFWRSKKKSHSRNGKRDNILSTTTCDINQKNNSLFPTTNTNKATILLNE